MESVFWPNVCLYVCMYICSLIAQERLQQSPPDFYGISGAQKLEVMDNCQKIVIFRFPLHGQLETTIKNFLSPKLAISGIDTLSLDPSIKTDTDAILQIKLICRYICHHSILLYLYVYELCTHSCV